MGTTYSVSLDHEEGNEIADVLSLTGRVNGTDVAAKVRISAIAKMSVKNAKLEKQKALIAAFEARVASPKASPGEKVVV